MVMRVGLSILVLIGALASGAARSTRADVISQLYTMPPTPLDWSDLWLVNQFDPTNGALVSVTLVLNAFENGFVGAENIEPGVSNNLDYTFGGDFQIRRPDDSVLADVTPVTNGAFAAGPYDGFSDFGGTSGFTSNFFPFGSSTTLVTQAADLAMLTGTGGVVFSVRAFDLTQVTGEAGKTPPLVDGQNIGQLYAELRYEFIQIPEPGTLALLLASLVPILLLRRQ